MFCAEYKKKKTKPEIQIASFISIPSLSVAGGRASFQNDYCYSKI